MSSIFVPELAVEKARNKFPAVFEKAITRFKHLNKPEIKVETLKQSLGRDNAISHIASREEEIWTVWANLCKASRV